MIFVAEIQRIVAEAHKVPLDAMRERDCIGTRTPDRVHARQEAMFLCREMCSDPTRQQRGRASFPSLGKLFRRDHSTVIHGVRAVEKRIASDSEVRRRIDAISVRLLI